MCSLCGLIIQRLSCNKQKKFQLHSLCALVLRSKLAELQGTQDEGGREREQRVAARSWLLTRSCVGFSAAPWLQDELVLPHPDLCSALLCAHPPVVSIIARILPLFCRCSILLPSICSRLCVFARKRDLEPPALRLRQRVACCSRVRLCSIAGSPVRPTVPPLAARASLCLAVCMLARRACSAPSLQP